MILRGTDKLHFLCREVDIHAHEHEHTDVLCRVWDLGHGDRNSSRLADKPTCHIWVWKFITGLWARERSVKNRCEVLWPCWSKQSLLGLCCFLGPHPVSISPLPLPKSQKRVSCNTKEMMFLKM
jgi:hypothetical protein